MSNVNIIKDNGPDQNLPEWPAKRYGAGQQRAVSRSALEIITHAPWQSLAVLVVFALICLLIVWRWRAVYCAEAREVCAAQADGLWTAVLIVGFVGSIAAAWYVAGRIRSRLSGAQAEAEQQRIVFDRFGNPIDIRVFTRPRLVERTQAAVAALQLATELEQEIAPHKRYSGVNTLTEGSSNNVTTDMALPPKVDLLPAPKPGESILEQYRRENIICRSNQSLHVGTATEDATPKYVDLKHWGVLANGGKTRSGKTNWTTYATCQMHMMGWSMVVCDKHGYKDDGLLRLIDPLKDSFLLPGAITREEIRRTIREVAALGARRLEELGRDPSASAFHFPLVLIVDEFANMVLADWIDSEVEAALIRIANEYAGVNIHGIINAHDWSAPVIGKERGAVYRRVTTHRLAHKMDAQGAEFLLPRSYGRMAEALKVGEAVYVDDDGPVIVRAPHITTADIAYAAANKGTWRTPPRWLMPADDGHSDRSALNGHAQIPPDPPVAPPAEQSRAQSIRFSDTDRDDWVRLMLQAGRTWREIRERLDSAGLTIDNNHLAELSRAVRSPSSIEPL